MIAAATDQQFPTGQKILLIEDSFLVGEEIRIMLTELGCTVTGPIPSLDEGLRLVESQPFDGAILDINLRGKASTPIAQELERQECPFFFVTGYGSPLSLPDDLRQHRRLNKPIRMNMLLAAIKAEFGSSE